MSFTDDRNHQETLTSEATVEVEARPNSPATGAPTIIGTAQVGETLTADTTGIADADGLDTVSFSYEWLSSRDTAISGATGETYTLVSTDSGKIIKVKVTFTDDAGNSETLTSAGTAAVAASANSAGICDRTAQVRETILDQLPDTSDCAAVTDTDLRYVTVLELENSGITTLQSGDFEGLSRLISINMRRNNLSALPDGVFDDLGNLRVLYLDVNHLSELPDDVFDDLANLFYLNLGNNGLSELPAGVFDELSNLVHLYLGFRWEHSIPDPAVYPENTLDEDDLSAGVLGNLSQLQKLSLSDNNLSMLPYGLFTGLTSLTKVNLIGNPGAPFTVRAELKQNGDTVVVKVTEGAPFDMLVTLSAEGGTLAATTVTVEGGSDSSGPVTVAPTGEEGAQVTVSVESVTFQNYEPHHTRALQAGAGASLTLSQNSQATGVPTISGMAQVGQILTASTSDISDTNGLDNVSYSYQWLADDTDIDGATSSTYTLQASDNGKVFKVRITFTDDAGNPETRTSAATAVVMPRVVQTICDRTEQVRDAILAKLPDIGDCSVVTDVELRGITELRLSDQNISALNAGDFGGLSGLETLELDGNELNSLPEDVFDGLSNLEKLNLSENALGTLPEDVFDGLSSLETLDLSNNGLSELPDDIFDGLASLETLDLSNNGLSELPDDIFDGLSDLRYLDLSHNNLSALPAVPASASNAPATGAPTIRGTAQVGETLTADITGIADADGLSGETFTYQWVSGDGTTDTDIENATDSTYKLVDADQGRSVKVRVTFTDDGGNEETLTSAPTAPVWGDGPPGAPRNLAATAGNKEVTLSWEPPDDNGNPPVKGYRIEWRVDGKDYDKTIWGTARSTTYTTNDQANLANGVKYFFRVRAGERQRQQPGTIRTGLRGGERHSHVRLGGGPGHAGAVEHGEPASRHGAAGLG